MTRYSASRGIRYTAPPGPDGNRRDADEEEEEAAVPRAADVEADGGEANGVSRPSSDANASDGGAEMGDGGLAADD